MNGINDPGGSQLSKELDITRATQLSKLIDDACRNLAHTRKPMKLGHSVS